MTGVNMIHGTPMAANRQPSPTKAISPAPEKLMGGGKRSFGRCVHIAWIQIKASGSAEVCSKFRIKRLACGAGVVSQLFQSPVGRGAAAGATAGAE